ncbi:MAG: ATP-grasp domain-containing protein, partial [Clostridia bacterium]|nr:ATP-grasp domain-containing protein [Clostridia bacterium]
MTDQIALVLGGTSPHVELINKLKQRGYYVILVDYLNNSPGIAAADQHIPESTLDREKVLQIAKETRASLVISTCIDQANSVCCYVAEQLGLPHPYSYQTSLDVTDKGRMKRIMTEYGISTSPYTLTTSVEGIDWDKVAFPAVVKPVDCNSSKGVHRADSREEVLRFVEEALSLSRTGYAIIEGFNEGDEIQVDCFAGQDGAQVLMTRQKKKIHGGNG